MPGGRIAPDNRGPQAKGVGKNSKRHDLERRTVPFLHDSDLQQGDVQAMENGQRVAPKQTQQPASQVARTSSQPTKRQGDMQTPDAIDFLGGRQGPEFNVPTGGRTVNNDKVLTWLPLVRSLTVAPGSSGLLASAFINQARELSRTGSTPATIVDLDAIDAGIETMLENM